MMMKAWGIALCGVGLLAACSDDTTNNACPPTTAQQLCVPESLSCCPTGASCVQANATLGIEVAVCKAQVWTCATGKRRINAGSLTACGGGDQGTKEAGVREAGGG